MVEACSKGTFVDTLSTETQDGDDALFMGIINELSLVLSLVLSNDVFHASAEFKNRNIKGNACKQIPEFTNSINTRIGITE